MNSHKFNMYAGATIGSLLAFLLLGFFSELIYVGGGKEENEQLAFAVEIEEAEGSGETAEAAETTDWAALVAAADTAKGTNLFKKCAACHAVVDGKSGVGPSLWGAVGRDIASAAGYTYSDALTAMDGNWDLKTLSAFLESPKGYVPGTKMSFGGLKKIEDRVDLIVYLNQAGGSPIDLVPAGGAAQSNSGASAPAATETEAAPAAEAATAAAPASTEVPATVPATPAPAAVAATGTNTAAAAVGGEDYASLLASADAAEGEKTFRKCKACHKVEDGKNGVGPSLWGVVNRDVASVEGFKFSDAMKSTGGKWTGANLFQFLENPSGVVPGTKMTFRGLKDAQDRINVITFLNEVDGSPELLE